MNIRDIINNFTITFAFSRMLINFASPKSWNLFRLIRIKIIKQ